LKVESGGDFSASLQTSTTFSTFQFDSLFADARRGFKSCFAISPKVIKPILVKIKKRHLFQMAFLAD